MPLKKLLTSPAYPFALASMALAIVAAAVLLQKYSHLHPCPLCIVQRVLFIGIAVANLAGAWRRLRVPMALLGALVAVCGIATAGWHVYVQAHPLDFTTCTPEDILYIAANFPFQKIFPLLLEGAGQCFFVEWSFLGVTLPQMSVAGFTLLGVLSALRLKRPARVPTPA
ncbi:disulfide bond formation protein B [Paraburkholderia sp. UCT31]|uniref:disulfide bond formation protein B n=1 Tax=Paraburkholderia sp. UCT31 TaxID=2615209 RepID=UPI00223B809F|nr:disulfide bond formation protein B [Paraburkholderia sp. UCT31]MBC8737312.1 disulfide bond formation protein B [Paraburkholderia sp. UCT31]